MQKHNLQATHKQNTPKTPQFVLRFVNGYWVALCLETFRHMEVFLLKKDGEAKMKIVNQ